MEIPKYARLEHERRFLVRAKNVPPLGPMRLIEDLYIRDSRLRLRAVTDEATGEREFKLCKKYPGGDAWSSPVVNTYLTELEHEALARLPGAWLRKRRHGLGDGVSVDVFDAALSGLVLCEAERESREALLALAPPAWTAREVTQEPAFTGAQLARTSAEELAALLARE